MQHFADVFEAAEAIDCPSSSCVSTARNSDPVLASSTKDEALRRRVEALGSRVYEFAEFLVTRLGVNDVGAYFPHRVTYHPTCSSLHLNSPLTKSARSDSVLPREQAGVRLWRWVDRAIVRAT